MASEPGEMDVWEVMPVSSDAEEEPRKKKKKSLLEIGNTEILRMKMHFLATAATYSTTITFVPVIAASIIGLSTSSIGSILTFQQISYIFISPLVGYVTDYLNKLKGMICFLIYLLAISLTLLLVIPPITKPPTESLNIDISDSCRGHETSNEASLAQNDLNRTSQVQNADVLGSEYLDFNNSISTGGKLKYFPCSDYQNFGNNSIKSRVVNCSEYYGNLTIGGTALTKPSPLKLLCCQNSEGHFVLTCVSDNSNIPTIVKWQFLSYQFWLVGLCIAISLFCMNSMRTLTDTACFEVAQKCGADFGRQRIFSALGTAIFVVISGLLYDVSGSYTLCFILMWVFCVISTWNLYKMNLLKPKFKKDILDHLGTVLSSKVFLLFLFGVILNGISISIFRFYFVLFMTRIGASRFLCGLALCLQKIFEIVFMFFSGHFIRRLGQFHLLSLCLLSMFAKFFCLSYVYNPWLTLPGEFFQGLSIGIFYPTVVSYAKSKSRPGTEATTQAVVFATFDGLGMSLGSFFFGWGLDTYGSHQMFYYSSFFFAAGAVVLFFLTLVVVREEKSIRPSVTKHDKRETRSSDNPPEERLEKNGHKLHDANKTEC